MGNQFLVLFVINIATKSGAVSAGLHFLQLTLFLSLIMLFSDDEIRQKNSGNKY